MSVQSGASGWTNLQNFTAIINTLKSVFAIVCPYQAYVPSFVDMWGFATASQSTNPTNLLPDDADRRIAARLLNKPKSYDGLTHQSLFTIPKHTRHQLAITKRIITDRKPIFVY
jgi:spermidine synthase